MYAFNGGTAVSLADDVQNFDIRYLTRDMAAKIPTSCDPPVFEEFTEGKRTSDGTSVTVSTPGGTTEGDLLIAAVATDESTNNYLSPPSGWNEIAI
jgi:hypothetical protein